MTDEHLHRRRLLQATAGIGLVTAASTTRFAAAAQPRAREPSMDPAAPLVRPSEGKIPVAFLVSDGAVTIDFAGPWAVFEEIEDPILKEPAFQLYTVAEALSPIRASGGLSVIPDYTFVDAPQPQVLVIPAQNGASLAMLEWIRQVTKKTDITMSVCTGAFLLAKTGLLTGRAATTHHGEYRTLAADFPTIHVQRNVRFVEDGKFASSGGLSCGIDLALRVVQRFFGRDEAYAAALNMEYQGQGWITNTSSYRNAHISTEQHPLCAVCSMNVDRALYFSYHSKMYYFCTTDHQRRFEATPDRYLA